MNIKDRILALCDKRNISINKLADLSGITQSTLNSIMNSSDPNPQFKTIEKICMGLEITLAEFFSEDKPGQDPLVPYIINHAEHMNLSAEQKAALEIYKKMPLSEQQQRLNDVLIKLNSLAAADREAIERIITSLSDRQ